MHAVEASRKGFEKAARATGCGALAGGLSVAVCTPVELVMIRLQTQDPLAKGAARGPLDCAKQIVRQSGMHGLYKAVG